MAEIGRIKRSATREVADLRAAAASKRLSVKRKPATGAGTAYARRSGTGKQ